MMNNRPTPNRLDQASQQPARALTCKLKTMGKDVVRARLTGRQ
jgi:hypothetical protein